MHHFSSPVLILSRQQGKTQQMVTSVTPLEDHIICGLRALLLMVHINRVFICLSLLQLHWAAGCASALLKENITKILLFFFLQPESFFYISDHQSCFYDNILLTIFTVETLGCSSCTEYHKHSQTSSVKLN